MPKKKELQFIDLDYKPKKDLVCLYRVEPDKIGMEEASNKVALESSIGTWDKVAGLNQKLIDKLGAKVFEIEGNKVKIAYPVELFELGNLPSILSGIAGNIFGMRALKNLRLKDIRLPKKIINSFKGPKFGIEGVRKEVGVKDRPLVGTIVKPKLGRSPKEHASYAYKAWKGGLDLVKSDENLTDQSFNKFKKRFKKTIKKKDKVEKETGEKKIYVENVTAETKEMLERAKYIEENGGNAMMIDVVEAGWSGFQSLRQEDLDLILHVHRAGHAMFTRNPRHGMSMLTLARLVRLVGGDELHIGAIFGKMEGKEEEVKRIEKEIENNKIVDKKALKQDWYGTKPVFAICSGGLHPGLIKKLVEVMGKDIIAQAGGGVAGHPSGIEAGGKAMRQALAASIENKDLKEYSKNHKELKQAIDRWGYLK